MSGQAAHMRDPSSRAPYVRFGGELPADCDLLLPSPVLPGDDVLLFSHGRAALAWFLEAHGPFDAALVCAYTCPTVPAFFEGRGLRVEAFDYGGAEAAGETADDIAGRVRQAGGRSIVLLPAPFGMAPWVDGPALARRLGESGAVVIDAAQSAFGHEELTPPPGGAVLACPRKALAIGDGAALRMANVADAAHASVAALPEAAEASDMKIRAREMFARRDPALEPEALRLATAAEDALPETPCRITARSREHLAKVDRAVHRERRVANAATLAVELADLECAMPAGAGTPFNWPFLAGDREALLSRLRARRVFATPLWPAAAAGVAAFPRARRMSENLVALPLDQRYGPADMVEMAALVRACL